MSSPHILHESLTESFGSYKLTPQHQRDIFMSAFGNFQTRYAVLLQEVQWLDPKVTHYDTERVLAAAGESGLEVNSYAELVKYLGIFTPAYLALKKLRRELVEGGGGSCMDKAAEMLNQLNHLDAPNKIAFGPDLFIPPATVVKEQATTGASVGVR
ncbi:hypothetical protein D3C71_78950 [compost metagenome]